MELNIIFILRAVEALFALIVFALSCYVVSQFDQHSYGFGSPDEPNFLLFDGVWTFFIALPYLVLAPIYFPVAAHRYILLGVETVTMIFWFAGFIALGAWLPSPKWCNGSVCSSLQAVTVFASFEWALFVASLVLIVLPIVRNRGSSSKPQANTQVQTQATV